MVHSDRGGRDRWLGLLTRIADAKQVRSTSRKGCSPDNAACEGFSGRRKTEMFFSGQWPSMTTDEFVAALDAYIRCTTTRGSRAHSASAAPRGTAEAWASRLNQSKFSAAAPVDRGKVVTVVRANFSLLHR